MSALPNPQPHSRPNTTVRPRTALRLTTEERWAKRIGVAADALAQLPDLGVLWGDAENPFAHPIVMWENRKGETAWDWWRDGLVDKGIDSEWGRGWDPLWHWKGGGLEAWMLPTLNMRVCYPKWMNRRIEEIAAVAEEKWGARAKGVRGWIVRWAILMGMHADQTRPLQAMMVERGKHAKITVEIPLWWFGDAWLGGVRDELMLGEGAGGANGAEEMLEWWESEKWGAMLVVGSGVLDGLGAWGAAITTCLAAGLGYWEEWLEAYVDAPPEEGERAFDAKKWFEMVCGLRDGRIEGCAREWIPELRLHEFVGGTSVGKQQPEHCGFQQNSPANALRRPSLAQRYHDYRRSKLNRG